LRAGIERSLGIGLWGEVPLAGIAAVGGEAEDVVDVVEEGFTGGLDAGFVLGRGFRGGGQLGSGGGSGGSLVLSFGQGQGVEVFAEVEGFPGDAGQDGEELVVEFGIGLGVGDGELGEVFDEAEVGHVNGGLLELARVGGVEEVEDVLEACGEDGEVVLVAEPVLVAGAVPIGEVALGDGVWEGRVAGLSKLLDDSTIGSAVIEGGVDEVAELPGETGDFAGAPDGRMGCAVGKAGGVGRRKDGRDGLSGHRGGGWGLGLGVHTQVVL
jgi:hypothetical protein